MGPFAAWAATGTGEARAASKYVSTGQTPERSDNKPFVVRYYRLRDVDKMPVDLPFPDSQGLRKFPGTHILLAQEVDHPLTNRQPVIPAFNVLHLTD